MATATAVPRRPTPRPRPPQAPRGWRSGSARRGRSWPAAMRPRRGPRSRRSLPARSASASPTCSHRRRPPGSAATPTRRAAAPARPQTLAVASGLERETRMAVQIQAMVAHSTGNWSDAVRQQPRHLAARSRPRRHPVRRPLVRRRVRADVRRAARPRPRQSPRSCMRARSGRGHVAHRCSLATLLGESRADHGGCSTRPTRGLREAVRLSREIGAVSAEAFASVRLGEAARARGELADGRHAAGRRARHLALVTDERPSAAARIRRAAARD